MFIDEVEIVVVSGVGGDGCASFRREKYIPRGGPDGGDGGRGGDVILRASENVDTLQAITSGRRYRAGPGEAGGGRLKHGADGESIVLEVPVGTLVRDADRGHVLRDLDADGLEIVIVHGGTGGRGNKHFAHATNQTPTRSTEGRPGESRRLRLELRLVADVGLVGLPNAGKSTLLGRVSAARPKVAEYPFTTLAPVLGLVDFGDSSLVMADIPGLIEGAHEGAGLGDRFLRHVARTRTLLHLVSCEDGAEAAADAYRTIRAELEASGLGMADKDVVVAVSKIDLLPDPGEVVAAVAHASGGEVLAFSSQSGKGLAQLLGRLRTLVDTATAPAPPAPRPIPPHELGHGDPRADET